jgi:hypothetical protein
MLHKLAHGVYEDDNGALHLDLAEMLTFAGFVVNAENMEMMERCAYAIIADRWPDAEVVTVIDRSKGEGGS